MNGMKSGYFDPDGTPKLRLSYCIYMDILGFSEISNDVYNNGQGDTLLAKLHKIISSQAKDLIPESEPELIPDWYAKLFTDNIVGGQIIWSSDGEAEFGFVIMKVISYQLQMALEGFFVRGGITIGDLFIDEHIVLGPALIEAHSIEQTIARDPRIVLSDNVFERVKGHMKYYAHPSDSPQYSDVLLDLDGKHYLNYLGLLFEDDDIDPWKHILEHKQHIEENLKKHRKNPIIWAKYQWLSNYHNFICDDYKNVPGFKEECMVNTELANRKPSRIV